MGSGCLMPKYLRPVHASCRIHEMLAVFPGACETILLDAELRQSAPSARLIVSGVGNFSAIHRYAC